jgi:hypothetical protein
MLMLICADFVGKNKEGRVGTVEVRVGGWKKKFLLSNVLGLWVTWIARQKQ